MKIQVTPVGVVSRSLLQRRQRRHDERLEHRVRAAAEREHREDAARMGRDASCLLGHPRDDSYKPEAGLRFLENDAGCRPSPLHANFAVESSRS